MISEGLARLVPLYGSAVIEGLKEKTVAVIGCGGVGAYAVEGLVRMGVGHLILMDGDVIETNNLNRLIIATHDTIGLSKTDVLKQRAEAINPDVKVTTHYTRFNQESQSLIMDANIDYIYDAIDSLKDKVTLIVSAREIGVPILSTTGQGNRLNMDTVCITDIFSTTYDPMARKLRKYLRTNNIESLDVVHAKEAPLKDSTLDFIASNPFVPATAGLRAAQYITTKLMEG